MAKGARIVVAESRCSRCLMCQLVCSFRYTRIFNPHLAKLAVTWDHEGNCQVNFLDDCNYCGLCVTYCVYGDLSLARA